MGRKLKKATSTLTVESAIIILTNPKEFEGLRLSDKIELLKLLDSSDGEYIFRNISDQKITMSELVRQIVELEQVIEEHSKQYNSLWAKFTRDPIRYSFLTLIVLYILSLVVPGCLYYLEIILKSVFAFFGSLF